MAQVNIPEEKRSLTAAATITSFLAAHGIVAAATAGDPKAAVVRIICVRK